MNSFRAKMDKRVNALADKVEVIRVSLIVDILEFNDPLEEKLVGKFKLLSGNLALVEYPNGDDQLAIVSIVLLWEHSVE